MHFSFTGRHMEIGSSLTAKAKESCEDLSKKYADNFIDVSIVMKKDHNLFYCDISIKSKDGHHYHFVNRDYDPVSCFTNTLPKIEQQMRKHKDKNKFPKKEHTVEFNEYDNSDKNENECGMIIAEILEDLPLMSVSDASNKLSDSRKIFVFENIESNATNVVYQREDGNIGWIDYKHKK